MSICFTLITILLCLCVLVVFPLPDYRNENMCLELMLIAAAANT